MCPIQITSIKILLNCTLYPLRLNAVFYPPWLFYCCILHNKILCFIHPGCYTVVSSMIKYCVLSTTVQTLCCIHMGLIQYSISQHLQDFNWGGYNTAFQLGWIQHSTETMLYPFQLDRFTVSTPIEIIFSIYHSYIIILYPPICLWPSQ